MSEVHALQVGNDAVQPASQSVVRYLGVHIDNRFNYNIAHQLCRRLAVSDFRFTSSHAAGHQKKFATIYGFQFQLRFYQSLLLTTATLFLLTFLPTVYVIYRQVPSRASLVY